MSYFLPGLWHFAAAMAWAVALGQIGGGDPLLWLKRIEFTVPLILASSALFFIPTVWAKKGPLKFLHYPLPDWDVLFLGPASHRNWLSHSPLLPLLLFLLSRRYPLSLFESITFQWAVTGLCTGLGSHLFWDCVGSRNHKIIVVPYWFAMREAPSRLWLLCGATLCLGGAASYGSLLPFRLTSGTPTRRPAQLLQWRLASGRLPPTRKTENSMEAQNIKPHLLAQGVDFPEGPSLAWHGRLYSVELLSGRIVRIEDGKCVEWLNTSKETVKGVPNGSKFRDGILYVCDSGRKQMLAITEDKSVRILADAAKGDLVNGPNDCAFDAAGNFYFSDPAHEQKTAAVYFCRAQKDGTFKTTEFAAGFQFPNGVAVSNDDKWVYIAETRRNRIWKYARKPDGSAGEGSVWCDLPAVEAGPDGIAFDNRGRLFVAHFGSGRIQIIEANGEVSASLDAGGKNPTNVTFSPDFRTLYVTEAETHAIYTLDLASLR